LIDERQPFLQTRKLIMRKLGRSACSDSPDARERVISEGSALAL
jgi:hypothetical protein